MISPEMQIIQSLIGYVLIFGFFTGLFFSGRFIYFVEKIWRLTRLRKRLKNAERVSTSDSGN